MQLAAQDKVRRRASPVQTLNGLENLSLKDQVLFEVYGIGEYEELPFKKIHHAFEYWAQKQPNEIAVEHFDKKITYSELDFKAYLLAQKLMDYGVAKGALVGLFLERSIEMTIGILAILKNGAAYIPQDARITPSKQLTHILDTTKAKVVLTLSHLKHKIPLKEGIKVIAIDEFFCDDQEFNLSNVQAINSNLVESNEKSLSFILFTSGTTGNPVGVKVTHQNLINILLTSPGNLGMKPGKKVSQILNIAFDMCAWETLGALTNGATLVIRGKDIEQTVKKVDIVIATPSILASIDAQKCRNVKVVAVAGEPCPRKLADTWSEFTNFHNSCGPTETTIVNTVKAYSPIEAKLTIGGPTPNNTVYILDEDLKPLPIGEIGEMWAGGLCVTDGYLSNDKLTHERYKPDPFLGRDYIMFRTRDLGRWTKGGELEHFGRTDDQVKIKGFRVELDSISNALESVDGCTQAVTLKINSETLISFVTPNNLNEEKLKKTVQKLLPYYCNPKEIIQLEKLPKTLRGKIDKKALTEMAVKKMEAYHE